MTVYLFDSHLTWQPTKGDLGQRKKNVWFIVSFFLATHSHKAKKCYNETLGLSFQNAKPSWSESWALQ